MRVKESEITQKRGQEKMSVVMGTHREVSLAGPGRVWYTRLRVYRKDAPPFEVSGHYDMTEEEALADFYQRAEREVRGVKREMEDGN